MKLLQEQFDNLDEAMDIAENHKTYLLSQKKQMIADVGDNGVRCGQSSDSFDYSLLGNLSLTAIKLNELKKLLETSEIIKTINYDKIDIGTTFKAVVGTEEDEYMMVDVRDFLPNEILSKCVTPSSPFGGAVIGKVVGDQFAYIANGKTFVGVVTDIIKPELKKDNQKSL